MVISVCNTGFNVAGVVPVMVGGVDKIVKELSVKVYPLKARETVPSEGLAPVVTTICVFDTELNVAATPPTVIVTLPVAIAKLAGKPVPIKVRVEPPLGFTVPEDNEETLVSVPVTVIGDSPLLSA